MCGRFYLDVKTNRPLESFDIQAPESAVFQNYNVTPASAIPIVIESDKGRMLDAAVWGLLPKWARAKNMKPMINARAETADTKPYFRSAFKYHRCLIPASGFYEWKRESDKKTPYAITIANHEIMAFAGLFEVDDDNNHSCAILTTGANKQMEAVHHRMPVILKSTNYEAWLMEGDKGLLTPFDDKLSIWPVSQRVNSPGNNDPDLIQPEI